MKLPIFEKFEEQKRRDKQNKPPKKRLAKQPNSLTKGRYDFTVVEKRVFYWILESLFKELNNGVTIEQLSIRGLEIIKTHEQLAKLDKDEANISRNYREACKKLKFRSFDIEDEDEDSWVELGSLFSLAEYKKKRLRIVVNPVYIKYLIPLDDKEYTIYNLVIAFALKSQYSQRMYELLNMYKQRGKFFLTIEEVKNMFMVEKWHPVDIRKNIFDLAKRELDALYDEEQCDLTFKYTEVRKKDGSPGRGGQVKHYDFEIIQRVKPTKSLENMDFITIHNELAHIYPQTTIDKIIVEFCDKNKRKGAKDFANKLLKIKNNNLKIDNIGGYIRTILLLDHDITF